MYKIYYKDSILYDPNFKEFNSLDAKLSYQGNSPDSLAFSLLSINPNLDKIEYMKSGIKVYKDSKKIFEGRVINIDSDYYNTLTLDCEGALSYLLDSQQEPYELHNYTVEQYFKYLISIHNSQMDEDKKFIVGKVTVTDSNDSLYRMSESYTDTLKEINDKLIGRLGGYLLLRYVGDDKYIDYLREEDLHESSQTIEFGKNLLDIDKEIKYQDIKTVIIPLGKKDSETGKYVDITSVNNNKKYIEDNELIGKHGRIVGTVFFDDVTVPSILKSKAEKTLKSMNAIKSLELNAIDLSNIDVNIENFNISEKVNVKSKLHKINQSMLVSKYELNLLDTSKDKITLGAIPNTLTQGI